MADMLFTSDFSYQWYDLMAANFFVYDGSLTKVMPHVQECNPLLSYDLYL